MNSFDHASHFVINGLLQTNVRIGDDNHKDKAFERLRNHAVAEASYDAADRYDAPKCHPETRKAVLKAIQSWIDDVHKTTRIMWLNGPAGAGKSAIAQTTAAEGRLVSSFFFSRFSASRNSKDGLVATIAYHLCLACPAVKNCVLRNVEKNPNIFKSNIMAQLRALVIEPFNTLRPGDLLIPRVVIIDGLDECLIRKDQAEIVKALINVVSSETSSGICFLLASRLEVEIRQSFENDSSYSLCSRLVLDDKFNPESDIELYLRTSLASLKRQHTLRSTLSVSWPPNEAIQDIVEKSPGQFIYASTVIQFISDQRHDPRKRLDIVLNIRPRNGETPFTQLDILYRTILSACRNYSTLSRILEAIMFLDSGFSYITSIAKKILASPRYLNEFLSLEDDCLLTLADFHALVDMTGIGKKPIRFHHASFYDFLLDPHRSKEFYIDRYRAHAHLAMCCCTIISKVSFRHPLTPRPQLHPPNFPEPVYTYCIECFNHFKSSNWDIDVLNYFRENGLLKISNQFHRLLYFVQVFYRYPIRSRSPLGFLVEVVDNRRIANPDLRDFIDSEILEHFQHHRQDDLVLLYHFRTGAGDGKRFFIYMSYIAGLNITPFEDDAIMNDFLCLDPAFEWFLELIQSSRYLYHLPDHVQANSVCRVLDIARCHHFNHERITSVFINAIDKLPPSTEIARTLHNKWESVENCEWINDKLRTPFRDALEKYNKRYERKSNVNRDFMSGCFP